MGYLPMAHGVPAAVEPVLCERHVVYAFSGTSQPAGDRTQPWHCCVDGAVLGSAIPSLQAAQPRPHKAAPQRPGIPRSKARNPQTGASIDWCQQWEWEEHPQFQSSCGSAEGILGTGAKAAQGSGRGESQSRHAAEAPSSSNMMDEHPAPLHKAAVEHSLVSMATPKRITALKRTEW